MTRIRLTGRDNTTPRALSPWQSERMAAPRRERRHMLDAVLTGLAFAVFFAALVALWGVL